MISECDPFFYWTLKIEKLLNRGWLQSADFKCCLFPVDIPEILVYDFSALEYKHCSVKERCSIENRAPNSWFLQTAIKTHLNTTATYRVYKRLYRWQSCPSKLFKYDDIVVASCGTSDTLRKSIINDELHLVYLDWTVQYANV